MCQHKILRESRKACYEEIHKALSRFGEHPLDRIFLWGARPWIDIQLDSSLVEGQCKIIIQRDDSPGKYQKVRKDSWISLHKGARPNILSIRSYTIEISCVMLWWMLKENRNILLFAANFVTGVLTLVSQQQCTFQRAIIRKMVTNYKLKVFIDRINYVFWPSSPRSFHTNLEMVFHFSLLLKIYLFPW